MKLKIEYKKYSSGSWYYQVYERKFIFFWIFLYGWFNSLQSAEQCVIQLLEKRKEDLKNDKELPVYYELKSNGIVYKKGDDGVERVMMVLRGTLWENHHSN